MSVLKIKDSQGNWIEVPAIGLIKEPKYKMVSSGTLTEENGIIRVDFQSPVTSVCAVLWTPAVSINSTYMYFDWMYDSDSYYTSFLTFKALPRTNACKWSGCVELLGGDLLKLSNNAAEVSRMDGTMFSNPISDSPDVVQYMKAHNYTSTNIKPITGFKSARIRAYTGTFPIGTEFYIWAKGDES